MMIVHLKKSFWPFQHHKCTRKWKVMEIVWKGEKMAILNGCSLNYDPFTWRKNPSLFSLLNWKQFLVKKTRKSWKTAEQLNQLTNYLSAILNFQDENILNCWLKYCNGSLFLGANGSFLFPLPSTIKQCCYRLLSTKWTFTDNRFLWICDFEWLY